MRKKVKVAVTAAIAIAAAVAVSVLVYIHLKNDSVPSGKDTKINGTTSNSSPTNLLCEYATKTAFNNDFIYYETTDGLVEYDTETNTFAVIAPKLGTYDSLSCYNMYNGSIYAIKTSYPDNGDPIYTIVTIDYNSGEISEIYSAEGTNILGCMSFASDGYLYFIEGKYEAENVDKNGYNDSFSILRFDLQTSAKEEILKANTFYIYDNVIYYTKLNSNTDCERLFYIRINDKDNITDTGIDVVHNVSEYTPYMYYPCNGKIYYSSNKSDTVSENGEYYCSELVEYDIESGEKNTVCKFDETSFVRYFQYFGDDMIMLVREKSESASNYQYTLYAVDSNGNKTKITNDDKLNEDYFYSFEFIDYISIFSDCEDYFLMSTYNPDAESAAYLVDKDYNITKIITNGEWDYEAYAKMQADV